MFLSNKEVLLTRAKQACVFLTLICSLLFISNAQATYYGHKYNKYSYSNHYGYKYNSYNKYSYNKYSYRSHNRYGYSNRYIYNNRHYCHNHNNYNYHGYKKWHWWKKKKHYAKGSVGDRVWLDENDNGIQDDGEQGAANVYVKLYKCDSSHVLKYTKTNSSGNYKFSHIKAGSYKIAVKPEYKNPSLEGVTFSSYKQGSDDALDSNIKSSKDTQWGIIGYSDCFDVEGNKFNKTIDAGLVLPKPNLLPEAVDDEYTGELDVEFTQNIFTENDTEGDGGITVTYVSGDIPEGLTLDADGTLSGIPTQYGEFTFTYEISDVDGDTDTAEVTITIFTDVEYCAVSAIGDEHNNFKGSHSFWTSRLGHLYFNNAGTVIQTLPNGNMTVSGVIEKGELRFEVNLVYSGFIESSSDPKLELNNSAYVFNGGPVDPNTWRFYENVTGTLTGIGGDWTGYVLSATRRGPMAQIGEGANGKNINFGLSNWFDFEVTTVPDGALDPVAQLGDTFYGDINVDLKESCEPVEVVEYCATSADSDQYGRYSGGHSVWIPAISRNLDFNPAGLATTTLPDGDISVTGIVEDGDLKFEVDLVYTDFSATSADPKLELDSSAYVSNGGPVDPSSWKFYNTVSGTITGIGGDWTGYELTASRRGPMAQIGDGANGKNITFGLSNWFDFTVSKVPSNPEAPVLAYIGDQFYGDINVDLSDCDANLVPDAIDDNYTGEVGVPFTQNIMDENDVQGDGVGTVAYVSGDPLPNGLTLEADGSLSGTPTESGTFVFTYRLTDEDGDSDEAQVTIVIDEENLVPVAEDDSYTLEVEESLTEDITLNDTQGNGTGTVTFVSGTIPPGFALNPDGSGSLSGTALEAGVFTFTYRLTDEDGDFDEAEVTITITNPNLVPIAEDDTYTLLLEESLSENITVNDTQGDGVGTVSLVSGTLPPGFALNPDGSGGLAGTALEAGVFTFTYRLTDEDGDFDDAQVTITVVDPNLVPIAEDDSYFLEPREALSENITDNDTQGDGTGTVTVVSGRVPSGFRLNSDGSISGSGARAGVFTFTYRLTDEDGDFDDAQVTITIRAGNQVPDAVDDSYNASTGSFFSQNIMTENDTQGDGVGTVTYVSGDPIPVGLTLLADGSLSGTPTRQGTFVFTYRLTDADGDFDDAQVTIVIRGPS